MPKLLRIYITDSVGGTDYYCSNKVCILYIRPLDVFSYTIIKEQQDHKSSLFSVV